MCSCNIDWIIFNNVCLYLKTNFRMCLLAVVRGDNYEVLGLGYAETKVIAMFIFSVYSTAKLTDTLTHALQRQLN